MGKEPSIEHPWQKTPTQLIQFAQDLMNEESDFKNQLAFLLIDVCVETMFITYLSLPDDVTGALTPYWERKKIIDKGSFHSLITAVKETARKSGIQKRAPATHFVTPPPLISSRTATTSALSRSCWGPKMFARL